MKKGFILGMALVGHLVQAGTSAAREAIEDPAAVDVLIERETAVLEDFRWKAHLSQTLPSVARDNRDNVKMCQAGRETYVRMKRTMTRLYPAAWPAPQGRITVPATILPWPLLEVSKVRCQMCEEAP